jgi:hypothetical protein
MDSRAAASRSASFRRDRTAPTRFARFFTELKPQIAIGKTSLGTRGIERYDFNGTIRETLVYVAITIATYVIIQAVTIVAHDFVHSTTAWFSDTCQAHSAVWGNPVTMKGWDEGVPYDQLFPSPGNPAQAAFGAVLLTGNRYITRYV